MFEIGIGDPIMAIEFQTTYKGYEISTEGVGTGRRTVVRKNGEQLKSVRGYDVEGAKNYVDSVVGADYEEPELTPAVEPVTVKRLPSSKLDNIKRELEKVYRESGMLQRRLIALNRLYMSKVKQLEGMKVEGEHVVKPALEAETLKQLQDALSRIEDLESRALKVAEDKENEGDEDASAKARAVARRVDALRKSARNILGNAARAAKSEREGREEEAEERVRIAVETMKHLPQIGREISRVSSDLAEDASKDVRDLASGMRSTTTQTSNAVRNIARGVSKSRIARRIPGFGGVGMIYGLGFEVDYRGYNIRTEGTGAGRRTIVERDNSEVLSFRSWDVERAKSWVDSELGEKPVEEIEVKPTPTPPVKVQPALPVVKPENIDDVKRIIANVSKNNRAMMDKVRKLSREINNLDNVIKRTIERQNGFKVTIPAQIQRERRERTVRPAVPRLPVQDRDMIHQMR